MVARVSRGSFGLSQYLITGKRKDNNLSRDEKDYVTTLYGNLHLFAFVEKYLVNNKSYKDNYLHLTLGFSKDDMKVIENVSPNKLEFLANLAQDYISYYTTGYDLDSEVIAYAEAHEPIIKSEYDNFTKKYKERLSHIHIAIALYNPVTDKQLRPPFFSIKRDDAFKSQMCEKYGFEIPQKRTRIKTLSQIGKDRARLGQQLNKYANYDALKSALQNSLNFEWREVETKHNAYIKIKLENGKWLNVRGKDFAKLEKYPKRDIVPFLKGENANTPMNPDIANADIDELNRKIRDEALEKWRKKRILEIDKARKAHERRKKAQENAEPCSISYQNKVFYNRYKTALNRDLKGYYIDTSKNNQTQFKAQGVDILDTGNKLTAKGSDLKAQVALMFDIAEAKKWNLLMLGVSGSEQFRAEVERQIQERFLRNIAEMDREKKKIIIQTQKDLYNIQRKTTITRTYSLLDSIIRDYQEKAQNRKQ